MNERLFRQLIIAEWVLAAMGTVAYALSLPRLPEPLRLYEQSRASAAVSTTEGALLLIAVGLLPLAIWNSVELYRFRPRSRRWFTAFLVLSFLAIPLGGPYVDSGWSQPFFFAGVFVAGIVFATIYWSPIASHFQRTPERAA